MKYIIRSIPNFSTSNCVVVQKIATAFKGDKSNGITLLDYSSDKDHNRSVFTLQSAANCLSICFDNLLQAYMRVMVVAIDCIVIFCDRLIPILYP